MSMPLPASVMRGEMAPTTVTWRPSSTHTVPSPMTMRQWKADQGSLSSRDGMSVSMVRGAVAALMPGDPPVGGPDVALPAARAALPLRRAGTDDALALQARLRRRRHQALRDGGRGGAQRAGLRPRGRRG